MYIYALWICIVLDFFFKTPKYVVPSEELETPLNLAKKKRDRFRT